MSLRLRLRLVLSTVLGALLVVTIGAALQFREIASLTEDVLGPDARLLEASAEMQRLLGEADRGPEFEEAFREQLAHVERAKTNEEEQAVAARVVEAFEAWIASREDEAAVRDAVAALGTIAGEQAKRTAAAVRGEATTAAIGLGILAAIVLVFGAWVSRAARVTLFDRLAAIDHAIEATEAGESTRRLGLAGDDELARVAAALDRVLDLRDRAEAAMQGRNREVRALLVALLNHWPRPAAVTGIDGEIIVSTLSPDQQDALQALAPQVRAAARTLLSRHFLTAAELATDVRLDATHLIAIRALALGEQRIVGWLATFGPVQPKRVTPIEGSHQDASGASSSANR